MEKGGFVEKPRLLNPRGLPKSADLGLGEASLIFPGPNRLSPLGTGRGRVASGWVVGLGLGLGLGLGRELLAFPCHRPPKSLRQYATLFVTRPFSYTPAPPVM